MGLINYQLVLTRVIVAIKHSIYRGFYKDQIADMGTTSTEAPQGAKIDVAPIIANLILIYTLAKTVIWCHNISAVNHPSEPNAFAH